MTMKMGESEILQSYREAKNHMKQVGILADLNCVTKSEMAQWLVDHGQEVAKTYRVEPRELAEEPEVSVEEKTNENTTEELKCVLTADQAYSVAQFIDDNLFDAIRADTEWDSLQALKNIIHAYEKMCRVSGYRGITEE